MFNTLAIMEVRAGAWTAVGVVLDIRADVAVAGATATPSAGADDSWRATVVDSTVVVGEFRTALAAAASDGPVWLVTGLAASSDVAVRRRAGPVVSFDELAWRDTESATAFLGLPWALGCEVVLEERGFTEPVDECAVAADVDVSDAWLSGVAPASPAPVVSAIATPADATKPNPRQAIWGNVDIGHLPN